MRKFLAGLAVVGLLCLGTGCSSWNDQRGLGDAPVANRAGDDSPATCTNMPDGFPNTCTKCLKGFEPWAETVTSDRTIIMIQAPGKCGGIALGAVPAEGN